MMERWLYLLRGFCTLVAGVFGFLYGNATPLLLALITFMIIDYITGVICAAIKHELSSSVGAKGIIKKIVIILIVAIAHIVDTTIIKEGSTMETMTAFFYLANEGISILENAVFLGLPVPNGLKKLLLQVKEETDEGTPTE